MPNKRTGEWAKWIAVIFLIAIVGILVPSIYTALEDTTTTTFEMSENETVLLTGELDGRLDIIDNQNATITIIHRSIGETITLSDIPLGSSETASNPVGDVTVTYVDRLDSNTAIIQFEYPTYYAWPAGSREILTGILIILIGGPLLIIYALIQGDKNGN